MKIDIELLVLISLFSIILGFLSCSGFYYAFKKYKKNEEDEFSAVDFGIAADSIVFAAILLVFDIILLISKAIFPVRIHLAVVRIISFLIGLFFLLLIVVLWLIALNPAVYK